MPHELDLRLTQAINSAHDLEDACPSEGIARQHSWHGELMNNVGTAPIALFQV